jgi:asparagine synthase (glutamine-hydrolysing)
LDGEFQIAVWDARAQTLTLANDRFGGLPQYWTSVPQGLAFAGGVRGVLVAPGVDSTSDVEALKEAVTFGGYRLGDRTNVSSVRMVGAATIQTLTRDGRRTRRYWTWADIDAARPSSARAGTGRDPNSAARCDLVDEAHRLWASAIRRRRDDEGRDGQTLSGGLDSRAILAEASGSRAWSALTYGIAGCDDGEIARRAAESANVPWTFQPLYLGEWLERRLAHVQHTDGLIDLHDLMHVESVGLQRALFDTHWTGYVGDAVCGPTFCSVTTSEAALLAAPYYGTEISLPYETALERMSSHAHHLEPASPRFTLFEHKLAQSTNRWTAAWRPYLRVRKPFLDYDLFEFWQALSADVRTDGRLYEHWLVARYPHLFARIPYQRTGVPVLAAGWRVKTARWHRGLVGRVARGLPSGWIAPRIRAYADDDRMWRVPAVRSRLVDIITRPTSRSAEIFGRDRLESLVARWTARAAAPAQVIGALVVFETYHAGLSAHLAAARAEARRVRETTLQSADVC